MPEKNGDADHGGVRSRDGTEARAVITRTVFIVPHYRNRKNPVSHVWKKKKIK